MTIRLIARPLDCENRFPAYATDWRDMNAMIDRCLPELRTWRAAVARHYAIATINERMRRRTELEAAFDCLYSAFCATLPMAVVCAA